MKRLISTVLIICAVLTLFSGCQAAPDSAVVAGKNDGTFESALQSEATASRAETEVFSYEDKFTSTDGKIEFNINVSDVEYSGNPMPVIQVTPKTITVEEAKRVAEVLFGDRTLYEYPQQLSKSELEERILYYRRISSYDYIAQEYADSTWSKEEVEAAIQIHMEGRLAILADLEEMYKTAPEVAEPIECEWEFRSASYYATPGSEYSELEDKTKEIQAATQIDDIQFLYWVNNREAEDYRNHSIHAFFNDLKIEEVREANLLENLYHEEEPTEEQVEKVKQQIEDMIERMDIGEWEITMCEGGYNQRAGGYQVRIEAAPIYNGIVVTPQPQLANLKSENEYASNYYYEKIEFMMGTEGELISFKYYGPLEVVDVVNEHTAVMSPDELKERIKTQLSLDDIGMYQWYESIPTEKVVMSIRDMEIGLARTKIKDNPTDFYLVPSVTIKGSYAMYDGDGNVIMTTGGTSTLLVLNLVDGTVIPHAN